MLFVLGGIGHGGGNVSLGWYVFVSFALSLILSIMPAALASTFFQMGSNASKRRQSAGAAFALGLASSVTASALAFVCGQSLHSLPVTFFCFAMLFLLFSFAAPFVNGGSDS